MTSYQNFKVIKKKLYFNFFIIYLCVKKHNRNGGTGKHSRFRLYTLWVQVPFSVSIKNNATKNNIK